MDELYELAPGRRMSISIEHDNPLENDAVIVYLGKHFVGYVRSGSDRERACSIIKASGRGSLLGKIVGVDRDKRWLWMEITTQCQDVQQTESKPTVLNGWNFDGEVLPCDEAELRLHTMLCNLEMTVEGKEPWDEDMEQWLEYIEQNLWCDISLETSQQVSHTLGLLMDGSKTHPEYDLKADRLQFAIDAMGSPEVRLRQANQILQKANSKEMDLLLLHYGNKAKENIQKLPEALIPLFLEDGERFMGRLWYLHRPYGQVQAVKTLLAMMVRLRDEDRGKTSRSIPEQWLLAWAERQKDKEKAEVVQDIITSFELEQTNPKLALQVQQMLDGCNPVAQQTEVLREVATMPRTNYNTFSPGSVSLNAGATLMGDINPNTNNHSTE